MGTGVITGRRERWSRWCVEAASQRVTRLGGVLVRRRSRSSRHATQIALRPHDPRTGAAIDKSEIVKGYEYDRGQFVTFYRR